MAHGQLTSLVCAWQDIRKAFKAKEMVKLALIRLRRLQQSLRLCLVKWKYRRTIVLCQVGGQAPPLLPPVNDP